MPKFEGDEVEYTYGRPGQAPSFGDAVIAATTKSTFVVAVAIPEHKLRSVPIEDLVTEVAIEVAFYMNEVSWTPDLSALVSPGLGVQIDPEKIRAALEAGMSRT